MILSVIIPMYNVEVYIRRCLDSCINQDLSSDQYEIIVINDGSPDNSYSIALEYAYNYKNITVLSQPNAGLSAARNAGINAAQGDYLFFVDSDDWIEDNCLSQIAGKLVEEQPDVLCICRCRHDGINAFDLMKFESEDPLCGPEALRKGLNPMAQLSIVRKSFLSKHDLYFMVGIYHEDSELTPRMHYLATKVSFLDGPIYNYYVNPKSIMRVVNPKRAFDGLTVCESLFSFARVLSQQDRIVFDNIISMYLNNTLDIISKTEKKYQKQYIQTIKDKIYLFESLKRSSVLKYNIEGFMMGFAPSLCLYLYKMMMAFMHRSNK